MRTGRNKLRPYMYTLYVIADNLYGERGKNPDLFYTSIDLR